MQWVTLLPEIHTDDMIRMLYLILFTLLVGMVLWGVILRGRSAQEWRRHKRWTIHLQWLHSLTLIVIIARYIQSATGFDDWQKVSDLLLISNEGLFWSILFALSLIGFILLQKLKIMDIMWICAMIAVKIQIGHTVEVDDRIAVSFMMAIHLFAASLWAGGLLYIVLLRRRYRYDVQKMILTFSHATLVAIILLTISGLISSAIYINETSNLLESRWGIIYIAKLVLVIFIIIVGAIITHRYTKNGLTDTMKWIKLDLVLIIFIIILSAPLTTSLLI